MANPRLTLPLLQAQMISGCERFYLVQPGDGCLAIATSAGVVLSDFYTWNPSVKTDCSGLLSGFFVCIGLTGAPATITSGMPFGPTPSPVQVRTPA